MRKTGPIKQHIYKCGCCNPQAKLTTSQSRASHESKMRKLGKGPDKKRFKASGSVATPSVAGSYSGTTDTKMEVVEFDMPNAKK
jgi:hypothetical protein